MNSIKIAGQQFPLSKIPGWKNPADPGYVGPVAGLKSECPPMTHSEVFEADALLDLTTVESLHEQVQRLQFELALEQESHKNTRARRDFKVKELHARIDELSAEVESAHRNLDVLSAPKAFDTGGDREAMNLGGRISALGELARDFFSRTILCR